MDDAGKELRRLSRTFPWEAIGLVALFGGLLARYLQSGVIVMGVSNSVINPRYLITQAERPVDYWIIVSLIGVLEIGSIAYAVFRFRLRRRN